MSESGGDTLGLVRSVAEAILASPKIGPVEQKSMGRGSVRRSGRGDEKRPVGPGAASQVVGAAELGSRLPHSLPPLVAAPAAQLASQLRELKISDPADSHGRSRVALASKSMPIGEEDDDEEDDYEEYGDDDDPEKSNPNLFVGDLSRTVTEEQLREVFSKFGEVVAVDIKRDKITQNNLGYGFVQFAIRDQAIKAKETLHGTEIGNRKIRIGWAQKNTTLFVGDLDGTVTTQSLRAIFSKFGPLVEEETFVKAGSGKFGFVRFRHRGDAERAKAEMNRKVIGSRPCRIGWGDNNIQKHCVHVQFNPTQGANLQEAQLKKHFEQFGMVKSVSLPRFGNNRLKGYGFVHFLENSEGEKAAGKAIATIAETKVGAVTIRCSYGKRQIYNRYRRHPKHYKAYPGERGDSVYPPPPGGWITMGGGPESGDLPPGRGGGAGGGGGGGLPAPAAAAAAAAWLSSSPDYSPALDPLSAPSPHQSPAFGAMNPYLYGDAAAARGRSLDQALYLPMASQGQSYYPPFYYAQQQSAFPTFGSSLPSLPSLPSLSSLPSAPAGGLSGMGMGMSLPGLALPLGHGGHAAAAAAAAAAHSGPPGGGGGSAGGPSLVLSGGHGPMGAPKSS